MRKYKAGSICFDEEINYYTDDFDKFYKENDKELTKKDMEEWAVWINSPWSQDHKGYEIKCNCKDAYTQIDRNELVWKCEYFIMGYDGVSASVIGYGNSAIEALENCKCYFLMLQEKYNPDNKRT